MCEKHLGDLWFDVGAYPVKDERGEVQQVVHVVRDITERKQAEQEFQENTAQVQRFNRLAVGRELRMAELKREVNTLLGQLG